jgi:hypothetical protein
MVLVFQKKIIDPSSPVAPNVAFTSMTISTGFSWPIVISECTLHYSHQCAVNDVDQFNSVALRHSHDVRIIEERDGVDRTAKSYC